jgi:hypothetical protein
MREQQAADPVQDRAVYAAVHASYSAKLTPSSSQRVWMSVDLATGKRVRTKESIVLSALTPP